MFIYSLSHELRVIKVEFQHIIKGHFSLMQSSKTIHVNPLENSSLAIDYTIFITGNFERYKHCPPQAQALECRKQLETISPKCIPPALWSTLNSGYSLRYLKGISSVTEP